MSTRGIWVLGRNQTRISFPAAIQTELVGSPGTYTATATAIVLTYVYTTQVASA